MIILALDPGIHTGWACLQDEELLSSGTINAKPAKHKERIEDFVRRISRTFYVLPQVELIAYEDYQSYGQHSGRVEQSAHINGLFTGLALACLCGRNPNARVSKINPRWKGRKESNEKLVIAKFGELKGATDHEYDAVGLAWHVQRHEAARLLREQGSS